jgi:hypothetical protein
MKTKKLVITSLLLLILFVFSGCNTQMGSTEPLETPPDAIYTSAAETIIAEYTLEAPILQEDEEILESTETLTPPDLTETSEPTKTNTATPTSTQTATQTSTQNEERVVIYSDDFSNPSLWYAHEEDDFGFFYEDDAYYIYNDFLYGAIWSVKYQEFNDVSLAVDAIYIDGPPDSYYGLVCRFSNDGMDYYGLVIGSGGFFGILKMEDGDLEFLSTGVDDGETILLEEDEINRIQGTCKDDKLILSVNDSQLIETVDDTFDIGEIGLMVGNRMSGTGIEVEFDNFVIYTP